MTKTLVSNAHQLDVLLKKKYGERLNTEPFATLMGRVEGTLDSKKFLISFEENKYLLISANSNSRDVLDELLPLLTEVMESEKPICSYDLQNEGMEEKDAMPTIEWDVVAPEKRIKEIVNGRAFTDSKVHNLKLYNSKKVEDYLESEQEKEDRIKNARISGIDPGSIKDVEAINNLSEVDLYFNIDALGGHIWRCRHDMAHGRIPEIDLTEEQYALEYMVYQTTKFGVELPKPTIDKHITVTPSYNAWYSFYSNHFKKVLTDEQWNAFQEAKKTGQDTSAFMPSGHWTDSLEQPIQKNL